MALINKIISFSCVDGPGNRMVIFFQGCNFKCLYCHNPETINKCISCGKCVENCEVGALSISDGKVIWDEEECISCDKCIKLCEHMSSPKLKEYSVEELVKKIEKDSFFIRGITVSGGECTLNSEFLIKLFREVKKLGLTCFVDTNGNTKLDDELINLTDKFMLDVKSIDEKENIWLTKSSNKLVLENLKRILELDKMHEVRTVIAKGLNSEKTVDEVSKIIGDKCRYKLIKYRPFGVREEGIKVHGTISPEDSYMNELKEKSIANGCIDTIIT
ncbi:YjjW family glycine radical enzyme activase [Clostridium perfringens]|uniref:YjjW family glycine radical enzyme activase n=1 Tax=Clostridium perfringens TaxID=1502 RepID=UPI002909B2AA|nr:YjjW family glycine radical enzyme activase [Clostridium perfringens]EJT6171316.1 YjjW family glycine radical enzyme activase [Clostridium perfringens]EJT6542041.1 YjjW family glycine radical enzyme activase [Clostridium perfringens]EJT6567049.1 YjjW family glycine radical enzyme activase [Clostridium perfringens]MBS5994217.1 YjjW family glycine radical enzyme activase [Clostridium perfringens]MDM0997297.1 YjjW family glycine radical enzyme activase [Clostridium perfringens]